MSSAVMWASNRIMAAEAVSLGLRVAHVADAADGQGLLLIEGRGCRFHAMGSMISVQSAIGREIARDKALTKAVLARAGLPVARGVVIRDEHDLARLVDLEPPWVLKPLDGTHGDGVVVGIATMQAVAAVWAERRRPLLCEALLRGREHRVVCVGPRLVAAALRKPAFVVGDGEHSVSELVAAKNREPQRSHGHHGDRTRIDIDDEVHRELSRRQLHPGSIPRAGEEVVLRRRANLSLGGEAYDVTDEVCAANRALFVRVAEAVDLRVVGIDVMSETLAEPLADQLGAGIIDVNARPGLRMHHAPSGGQPRNVARAILELVLGSCT
jgi:cyanophycin synthetase